MSSDERKQILKMVEEGKISPQEAAKLMSALDQDKAEPEIEVVEAVASSGFERSDVPEFDAIKSRARRFSLIPLWAGVFVTVLSAWIIYAIQQSSGSSFWFYCMILPLMLGVLLIALGAGGRSSRWIYINVDRKNAKDGPRHITLGFPLPLGLVAWFFRTFGHNIHGMDHQKVEGIVQMMEATRESGEPFMVNVDDDDDHVQVFIG